MSPCARLNDGVRHLRRGHDREGHHLCKPFPRIKFWELCICSAVLVQARATQQIGDLALAQFPTLPPAVLEIVRGLTPNTVPKDDAVGVLLTHLRDQQGPHTSKHKTFRIPDHCFWMFWFESRKCFSNDGCSLSRSVSSSTSDQIASSKRKQINNKQQNNRTTKQYSF